MKDIANSSGKKMANINVVMGSYCMNNHRFSIRLGKNHGLTYAITLGHTSMS